MEGAFEGLVGLTNFTALGGKADLCGAAVLDQLAGVAVLLGKDMRVDSGGDFIQRGEFAGDAG